MSCVTGRVGAIFFVRWQTPELRDLAQIQDQLNAAYKELGRPLTYIAIIPADCPPPSAEVRTRMGQSMDVLLETCSTLHFVIEGSGFKHSMLRSVLAGILLVSGKRGRSVVHTSIDEALVLAVKGMRVDAASIRRSARALQLIA